MVALEHSARDYLATGTRRMFRTFRHALDDAIELKTPLLRAPTLIIRGSRDTIVPQRWVERLTESLPRGRLAVIPGGTHATHYSSPDLVAHAVRDFLSEYPPGSSGTVGGTD